MKHQYQVLVFHREGLLVTYGLFRQNRIDRCFGPLVSAATARADSATRTGHRVYHDGVASARGALRQGLLGAPAAAGNRLQILVGQIVALHVRQCENLLGRAAGVGLLDLLGVSTALSLVSLVASFVLKRSKSC